MRDVEETTDEFGRVRCDDCGHEHDLDASIVTRVCGGGAAASWRDAVQRALPRFRCSACGARSSSWDPPKEFPVVLCEVCDRPVPPARLAAAPGTTRCVTCESVSEGGGVEHGAGGIVCRRCGAPMCWRVRRAEEPAKYFLGCTAFPACRYTEE
jgi:hypothetical protein